VVGVGRIKVMVGFCGTSLEEGLKSEGVYVIVVGRGVGRVDSARAAAGPGYLKDVFEGRLVEIINPRAVDATVRDPLCWDLYLTRDVVQGKKGAEGGGKELTPGVHARDPFLSRKARSVEADWSDESDGGVAVA
jgi:hypothetical protein